MDEKIFSLTDFPASVPTNDIIKVGTDFQIFSKKPIAELKTYGASAYHVTSSTDPNDQLFAYIADTDFPLRHLVTNTVLNEPEPNTLTVVKVDKIASQNGGRMQHAVILRKPLGLRYSQPGQVTFASLNALDIDKFFLRPMIELLKYAQERKIYLGTIRPDNLYFRAGEKSPIMLGDFYMLPSGIGQPSIFEPITRAITPPHARGEGTEKDDVYAFGVTFVCLLLGHIPMAQLSTQDMANQKLEKGTYTCIAKSDMIPSSFNEFLRGVLSDDPIARWTVDEIEHWLSGQRLNQRTQKHTAKAGRQFEFTGKQYSNCESLVIALGQNYAESVKVIENDMLENWLKRSFASRDLYTLIHHKLHVFNDDGQVVSKHKVTPKLFSEICLTLAGQFPLFFQDICFLPSGFGVLLMDAFVHQKNLSTFLELLKTDLIEQWYIHQDEVNIQEKAIAQLIQDQTNLIKKSNFRTGLERMLYELNPELYCLSPLISKYKVLNLKDLIISLEQEAQTIDPVLSPTDIHITSFITSKQKGLSSHYLNSLIFSNETEENKALAMLYLFGTLQQIVNIQSLPYLSKWLLHKLKPFFIQMHDTDLRDKTSRELALYVDKGEIYEMHKLLNTQDILERDHDNYNHAITIYNDLIENINGLKTVINNPKVIIQTFGRYVASAVSTFTAVVIIIYITLRILLV